MVSRSRCLLTSLHSPTSGLRILTPNGVTASHSPSSSRHFGDDLGSDRHFLQATTPEREHRRSVGRGCVRLAGLLFVRGLGESQESIPPACRFYFIGWVRNNLAGSNGQASLAATRPTRRESKTRNQNDDRASRKTLYSLPSRSRRTPSTPVLIHLSYCTHPLRAFTPFPLQFLVSCSLALLFPLRLR